jgi:undecaprenyl-diphosphatase
MVFIKAIILGLVEGITEFLPISSTGHMVLVDAFLKLSEDDEFTKLFTVVIQLPAILAIVVLYWRQLWPFSSGQEHFQRTVALWTRIVVAFVPAAIAGALFNDAVEAALGSMTVAIALVAGGVVLIGIERKHRTPTLLDAATLPMLVVVGIGLFQCLAMVPGTSRSAATIIGAMLLGASRPVAAEFSFFLAIPTMLGAATVSLFKHGTQLTWMEWAVLAVGCVVSFVTALVVVAAFVRYIQARDFKVFGYYRIVLGIIVLLYLFAYSPSETPVAHP